MSPSRTRFWSVRQAWWLRPLVALLVPIGGLFAALALFHSALDPTQNGVPLWTLVITAGVFTVYSTYLFLLATLEVLGQPVERYAGPGLLVFGLTILAYIFMAAKLIDASFKGLTWMALAASYFVGAIHHYHEQTSLRDRAERFRQGLWVLIDFALFGLLALATAKYLLLHDPSLLDPLWAGLTIKCGFRKFWPINSGNSDHLAVR